MFEPVALIQIPLSVGAARTERLPKRFAPASRGLSALQTRSSGRAPHPLPSCRRAARIRLALKCKQTLNIYSGMPPNMCPRGHTNVWFRRVPPRRRRACRSRTTLNEVECALSGNCRSSRSAGPIRKRKREREGEKRDTLFRSTSFSRASSYVRDSVTLFDNVCNYGSYTIRRPFHVRDNNGGRVCRRDTEECARAGNEI